MTNTIDCAVCCHPDRSLIERMLSRGESLSYLSDRFVGLGRLVFRNHRDLHMDVVDATAFASPQHHLSDLQEARLLVQRVMDLAGGGETPDGMPIPPRPAILLNAIESLRGVLEDMSKVANQVRKLEVNEDAKVLQLVLKEVLARHPDALMDFNRSLQQRLLITEEET